jgi:tetratricopeptide (TPR) repeat protein
MHSIIMKRFLITAATALLIMQPGEVVAQARIEAIVVPNEGRPLRVWITQVGTAGIRYFRDTQTTAVSELALSQTRAIFFPDSQPFVSAMQQYRAREYRAAADSFAKVAADFQVVRPLPNNPSSRAAFFEIECLRLLGEYGKMAEKLGDFNKSGISRENEVRQLELNLMWDAVGRKAWDQLGHLVDQHSNTRMPGNQRVQVAYCKGLVLENKGESKNAIDAYNEAIIIDAAASEVVARMAALAILRIHDSDPDVKIAREMWGSEDFKRSLPGYAKLLEAGAVARIYETFISAGAPLPDQYTVYLEYKEPDAEP